MVLGREDALAIISTANGDGISTNPLEVIELINALENKKQEGDLQAQEHQQTMLMRGSWSIWILRCIVAIVIFDFFLVTCVGFGWMHFEGSLFLPVFIADSLIKTFGLAWVVVNYLFNNNGKKV